MEGADELHRYTATIQKARVIASTTPYNPGGNQIDFGTPAATTTVNCRFQRLDSVTLTKTFGGGVAGASVAADYMYLAYAVAPASLLDQDSSPPPENLHRIVTVLRPDGTTMDTGPFEIVRIIDMAGANDVLKLELRRVS